MAPVPVKPLGMLCGPGDGGVEVTGDRSDDDPPWLTPKPLVSGEGLPCPPLNFPLENIEPVSPRSVVGACRPPRDGGVMPEAPASSDEYPRLEPRLEPKLDPKPYLE